MHEISLCAPLLAQRQSVQQEWLRVYPKEHIVLWWGDLCYTLSLLLSKSQMCDITTQKKRRLGKKMDFSSSQSRFCSPLNLLKATFIFNNVKKWLGVTMTIMIHVISCHIAPACLKCKVFVWDKLTQIQKQVHGFILQYDRKTRVTSFQSINNSKSIFHEHCKKCIEGLPSPIRGRVAQRQLARATTPDSKFITEQWICLSRVMFFWNVRSIHWQIPG